jgi:hypothetical protein
MILDERDIALTLENRTRQLWAEKNLEMAPSAQEEEWAGWSKFLHTQVEEGLKGWLAAVDMTPATPEEPFTSAYQARLGEALHSTSFHVIGAHYVCGNASVRGAITESCG